MISLFLGRLVAVVVVVVVSGVCLNLCTGVTAANVGSTAANANTKRVVAKKSLNEDAIPKKNVHFFYYIWYGTPEDDEDWKHWVGEHIFVH
jgi:hypothetical protein